MSIGESQFPQLAKAPIVEAVFDIQSRLEPSITLDEMRSKAEPQLRQEYPEVKTQRVLHQHLSQRGEEDPDVKVSQGVRGFQFHSKDGKHQHYKSTDREGRYAYCL